MFHVPEKGRVIVGPMASNWSYGNNGQFKLNYIGKNHKGSFLLVTASDGAGWEHVSVSVIGRKHTPIWNQMSFVKDVFWDEDDTVVQFHPKKAEYVNYHKYVLHLWRKIGEEYELPPAWMVGPKS